MTSSLQRHSTMLMRRLKDTGSRPGVGEAARVAARNCLNVSARLISRPMMRGSQGGRMIMTPSWPTSDAATCGPSQEASADDAGLPGSDKVCLLASF
ncbi:hypothetical protein OKW41_002798 [Paraburkholderia sp. UCT70]